MTSQIHKHITEKVKERRTELSLSQLQLSLELNMDSSFISHVESNKYKARYTLDQLAAIAVILDCQLCDFMPNDVKELVPGHVRVNGVKQQKVSKSKAGKLASPGNGKGSTNKK